VRAALRDAGSRFHESPCRENGSALFMKDDAEKTGYGEQTACAHPRRFRERVIVRSIFVRQKE
jgi:hypothetical protein